MFEIGNTLREARLRRGLDIARCEAETKIRAKYLRAMEEEQFDLLPAPTYVRGFLRSYADFLDLDGQLVLDEYESRFGDLADVGHDVEVRPRSPARPRGQGSNRRASAGPSRPPGAGPALARTPRPKRSSEARLLWLAIGGVMAVALLVWLGVGDGGTDRNAIPATPQSITTPTTQTDEIIPPPPPGPQPINIILTGIGENGSFMQVHALNSQGRQLFADLLDPGEAIRFPGVRRRIWVQADNPGGVELKINGRVREMPEAPGAFYITRRGVVPISAG